MFKFKEQTPFLIRHHYCLTIISEHTELYHDDCLQQTETVRHLPEDSIYLMQGDITPFFEKASTHPPIWMSTNYWPPSSCHRAILSSITHWLPLTTGHSTPPPSTTSAPLHNSTDDTLAWAMTLHGNIISHWSSSSPTVFTVRLSQTLSSTTILDDLQYAGATCTLTVQLVRSRLSHVSISRN